MYSLFEYIYKITITKVCYGYIKMMYVKWSRILKLIIRLILI